MRIPVERWVAGSLTGSVEHYRFRRFDALEHRINIASRTPRLTGASTPAAVTVPAVG